MRFCRGLDYDMIDLFLIQKWWGQSCIHIKRLKCSEPLVWRGRIVNSEHCAHTYACLLKRFLHFEWLHFVAVHPNLKCGNAENETIYYNSQTNSTGYKIKIWLKCDM